MEANPSSPITLAKHGWTGHYDFCVGYSSSGRFILKFYLNSINEIQAQFWLNTYKSIHRFFRIHNFCLKTLCLSGRPKLIKMCTFYKFKPMYNTTYVMFHLYPWTTL